MKPRANPTSSQEAATSKIGRRWTGALIKQGGGFTPVSVFFLEHYSAMKLTHGEALLIIHLMRYKFDERAPFPSFEMLARNMGVSAAAVRGYARNLEKRGFLKRCYRTARTNQFDLTPLFEVLESRLLGGEQNQDERR